MKVRLKNLQKAKKIDLIELRRRIGKVLCALGQEEKQIEIVLCDNRLIRELNRDFLGKDNPTDVIAFPLDGEDCQGIWGIVVISVEEADIYSRAHGLAWQEEMLRYIVHGILHLHGYKDKAADDRQRMRRKENQLLKKVESRD